MPLQTYELTLSPGCILAVMIMYPFLTFWKGCSSVIVSNCTLFPAIVLHSDDLWQIVLKYESASILVMYDSKLL
jgi:hypothetical protein